MVPTEYQAGWIPQPMWTCWQREKSLPLLETKYQSSSLNANKYKLLNLNLHVVDEIMVFVLILGLFFGI
jgi:hypothetical protein